MCHIQFYLSQCQQLANNDNISRDILGLRLKSSDSVDSSLIKNCIRGYGELVIGWHAFRNTVFLVLGSFLRHRIDFDNLVSYYINPRNFSGNDRFISRRMQHSGIIPDWSGSRCNVSRKYEIGFIPAKKWLRGSTFLFHLSSLLEINTLQISVRSNQCPIC